MQREDQRKSRGYLPRNNLRSTQEPRFASQRPDPSSNNLTALCENYSVDTGILKESQEPQNSSETADSPPSILFTGRKNVDLSDLGDSSSLFSFSSPGSVQFAAGVGYPSLPGSSQVPSIPEEWNFRCSIENPSKSINDCRSVFKFESPPVSQPSINPKSQFKQVPKPSANRLSGKMVVEREPPRSSLTILDTNSKAFHEPSHPEFGKTSALQSPFKSSAFNVPKANKPRPEHHRTAAGTDPTESRQSSEPRDGFINPLKPRILAPAPTARSTTADEDVVEISRPTNPASWSTFPSRPPTYSSFGNSTGGFTSVNQFKHSVGTLIDLTSNVFGDKFGSADPYEYVDAAKAEKNIKALLEGAFEDDDDKPRTRGRKKKLEGKVDALAHQLSGLAVKPEKEVEEGSDIEEDDGTVVGLKVKLLPHQVDGVEWMRDKEMGARKKNGTLPKGGILADDMGLGKTIQSISLLLLNPRPPPSRGSTSTNEKNKLPNDIGKGTLVVAPLALIKQWEAEISNRVENDHRMRVCIHHGPQRTKRFEDLRKYDVVITTYQILVSEHGSSAPAGSEPQVGCFGIHWYRVILDEAHTIKNRNAKATKACCALRSEFRWCLTGTPMQNNLDEIQSLIKFLRIKPYDDFSVWKDQIIRPMKAGRGGVAMKRLQFYLKAFMKRRTKDVLKAEGALNPGGKVDVEGKASLGFKITERRIENVIAELSPDERVFYDRLEQRADKSLERMMGGDKINYASALVLLLRLRQACNHPELVGGFMAKDKDALTTDQIGDSRSPKKPSIQERDLDEMADLLGSLSVQTKQCDVCQIELSKEESSGGSIRCMDCEKDLVDQRRKRKELKVKKNNKTHVYPILPLTKKEQKQPRNPKGRHIIEDSDDEDEGDWIVPEHQRQIQHLGKAGGSDDENAEGEGEWLASGKSDTSDEPSRQFRDRQKPKIINLDTSDEEVESSSDRSEDEEDEDDEDDEDDEELDEESIVVSTTSTKIQHLLQILRRESAKHKFIVFSQFTSMLNLIEPFLDEENFNYTRYDGSMRNDEREASLERLRNNKKTRILLCSLKCGSLGLNLTAASRVVILEPFWNPFVEEQAIDRVHRLNQTVDVVVYKLTIANSVEERILDLQEKKRALAEAAIEGKAVAKLSMEDMLRLFKRDAEHDDRHNTHSHLDLGTKTRVLPVNPPILPVEPVVSSGVRRNTPPVFGSGAAKAVNREDPTYGRRW